MTAGLTREEIFARRAEILGRIAKAAKWANRDKAEVNLVAVTKQQSAEHIEAILEAGHHSFGENRVQEAEQRWGETFQHKKSDLELRLIGPLQTNKAHAAVKLFDVIETIDRVKLVEAVLKGAEKEGRCPDLLVQVNIGNEEQKSGIKTDELGHFLEVLDKNYKIFPNGLMCIPPAMEAASPYFWEMLKLKNKFGLQELSMGMSADFETAIKMGSTHIRVGSALLGSRASAEKNPR